MHFNLDWFAKALDFVILHEFLFYGGTASAVLGLALKYLLR